MMNRYIYKIILCWFSCFVAAVAQPTVSVTTPLPNTSITQSTPIVVSASATAGTATTTANSPYLEVSVISGWRKLKLGYSTTSLWSPIQNVVSTGNNKLEVTLKTISGTPDWNKLQIRPQGSTASPVSLNNYMSTALDLGNGWKKITIPLTAFASSINFSQLTYIEVPYSINGSSCILGISRIAFTGGTTPFEWFGPSKNNNYHNGATNDADALPASVITIPSTTPTITKVEFLVDGSVVGEDVVAPYSLSISSLTVGTHQITARVTNSLGQTTTSTAVAVSVISLPPVNLPTLTLDLTSPVNNSTFTLPDTISLATTANVPTVPLFFQITNTTSGWRKIRLGYTSGTLSSASPKINVVGGGNNSIELVIKNISGTVSWSKIQLRPQGFANAPLVNIGSYISSAQNLDDGWLKVTIPLPAFYSGIDFTKLTFLEFYSNNAPNFVMGIRSIIFKGSTTPFEWFGPNKFDNAHTGTSLNTYNMLGTVIPAQSMVTLSKIEFFANATKIGEDLSIPYHMDWIPSTAGTYQLYSRAVSNNAPIAYSDTAAITLQLPTPIDTTAIDTTTTDTTATDTTAINNPNLITLLLQLDSTPSSFSIEKTPLRYNKKIAYSLSLDDGLLDAYTIAKPVLNGGSVLANATTYPGLFYTDGCGNSQMFRAGVSVFSVNNYDEDLHNGSNNTYLTWQQIDDLYSNGWDIFNHSYTHASRGWNSSGQLNDPLPSSIYNYQITANAAYIQSHTNHQIATTHFIVPSGDDAYYQPALSNHMKAVYNQSWQILGGNGQGISVDDNLTLPNLVLNRVSIEDNTTTINNTLSNLATIATEQNPIWYNEFTHNVGSFNGPIGGGLQFSTFNNYMQHIGNTYGKNGSDIIWFAPLQEVYEYLQVKQKAIVNHTIEGNTIRLTIALDSIDSDLRRYELSLKVNSSANITSISSQGGGITPTFTFKGSGTNKLINLEWDNVSGQRQFVAPPFEELPPYLADQPDMCQHLHGCEEAHLLTQLNTLTVSPNPAQDEIVVGFPAHNNGEVALRLYDTSGKLVGFRKALVFEGQNAIPIKLSDMQLSTGTYLIKAESANSQYGTVKFVKQ